MSTALTLMTLDAPLERAIRLGDLRALVAEADRLGLTDDTRIIPQAGSGERVTALWIQGGRPANAATTT